MPVDGRCTSLLRAFQIDQPSFRSFEFSPSHLFSVLDLFLCLLLPRSLLEMFSAMGLSCSFAFSSPPWASNRNQMQCSKGKPPSPLMQIRPEDPGFYRLWSQSKRHTNTICLPVLLRASFGRCMRRPTGARASKQFRPSCVKGVRVAGLLVQGSFFEI